MNAEFPHGLHFRLCEPADHSRIIQVMKEWWNGRDLTYMLPRLFLNHFYNTSFVVDKDHELVAFLVGFLSQSQKHEGYIHFAGVAPPFRDKGIGSFLYNQFFQLCRENHRRLIKSCTSPVNKGSITFHTKMGFTVKTGNSVIEGIQVTLDYNRPDDPKVLFEKLL